MVPNNHRITPHSATTHARIWTHCRALCPPSRERNAPQAVELGFGRTISVSLHPQGSCGLFGVSSRNGRPKVRPAFASLVRHRSLPLDRAPYGVAVLRPSRIRMGAWNRDDLPPLLRFLLPPAPLRLRFVATLGLPGVSPSCARVGAWHGGFALIRMLTPRLWADVARRSKRIGSGRSDGDRDRVDDGRMSQGTRMEKKSKRVD